MTNIPNIEALLLAVEHEFEKCGVKKDLDPRTLKKSYNILKQANGLWFKSTKEGLHTPATVSDLDLSQMPALLELTQIIDASDPEFAKFGGRIFINDKLVFKIVKGTSYPILISENQSLKKTGKYQKICNELLRLGFEKDRFRVEETYMLCRTPKGEWSITSGHANHSGTITILTLDEMPEMKSLAASLNKVDLKFKSNGGRIFITPMRIYRLQNKVEIDYKL